MPDMPGPTVTASSTPDATPRSKRLLLCADDFAQNEAISNAILELIRAGRLSATSCMTQAPLWPQVAPALLALRERVDIGLHFNLTHDFNPAGSPPHACFPLFSLMGVIPSAQRTQIRQSLQQQLDHFEACAGMPPDFVDGHQHVHVFPAIRGIVLDVLAQRYPQQKPWLRRVAPPLRGHDASIKALVLRMLAAGFSRTAIQAGFRLSGAFSGMYSLTPEADFPHMFEHWLHNVPDGALIMCHPGLPASDPLDPIGAARRQEYHYLVSDRMGHAMASTGTSLARHQRIASAPDACVI